MDSSSDGDLPRGIALAWGVAANPQRGPRRELTLEGIVDAAVRIADADGLASVSMASVSAALGFTTMSLYRYVSAKDDLVLLMQESGFGLPPLRIGDVGSWREGLSRWYGALLDVYARHPWLLDIPLDSEPSTPNNLAWLDAGLSLLVATPLDQVSRVSVLLTLSGHSRWVAQILRNHADPTISAATLAELITPEQFPNLAPAIADGAFARSDDGSLEFGLLRILDGVELHVAELEAGRRGTIAVIDSEAAMFRDVAKDERVKKSNERVRDAESNLRDARQKLREAVAKARERR